MTRYFFALTLLLITTAAATVCTPVKAEPLTGQDSRTAFELSGYVEVPLADRTVQQRVRQIRSLIDRRQYDEAVDILCTTLDSRLDGVLQVSENRYVGVARCCRLMLTELPPEALAIYRRRVDPLAETWYQSAISSSTASSNSSITFLERIIRDAPLSSVADQAIDRLAQIRLESGHYAAARALWRSLIPIEEESDASPPETSPPPPASLSYSDDLPQRSWFVYPDSDIDPALLRSRLVLTSILAGEADRARRELDAFKRLDPNATGTLAGRTVVLADELARLLDESTQWPPVAESPIWPTFTGSANRQRIVSRTTHHGSIRPSRFAWQADLPPLPSGLSLIESVPAPAVAETPGHSLGYFPVSDGTTVFVNTLREIRAYDLTSGSPVWGATSSAIYRDPEFPTDAAIDEVGSEDSAIDFGQPSLFPARSTLTLHEGKLLARMGPPTTVYTESTDVQRVAPGVLVCLDLEAQGRLLWRIAPDDPHMAFEGTPICRGDRCFVAMRRSDVTVQVAVACYDLESGRMLWRQPVGASETPSRGRMPESSHLFLTLAGDTLYLNTGQGVIAAIDIAGHAATDGAIRWLTRYPQRTRDELSRLDDHWFRDTAPCVFHQGLLYVAPRDTDRILALDADDGRILWATDPADAADVVHLLGVIGDHLIASGRRLYWIDTQSQPGRVTYYWPDGDESPGHGRGLLVRAAAGTIATTPAIGTSYATASSEKSNPARNDLRNMIYFPIRSGLLVFDADSGELLHRYDLLETFGVSGGNLTVSDNRLLITSPRSLTVFSE